MQDRGPAARQAGDHEGRNDLLPGDLGIAGPVGVEGEPPDEIVVDARLHARQPCIVEFGLVDRGAAEALQSVEKRRLAPLAKSGGCFGGPAQSFRLENRGRPFGQDCHGRTSHRSTGSERSIMP